MGKSLLLILFCVSSLPTWSEAVDAGAPAHMIITLGHHYGQPPPMLTKDDLTITQDNTQLPLTSVVPLRDERAGLELFVLVDHCSTCEATSQFEELRKFIASQPPSTAVGVAYIRDGLLEIEQKPTADRERAIQSLTTPSGSKPSSPFRALTDLIQSWTQDSCRHAVLMISNGIDPAAREGEPDAPAEAAIVAAQRAGVTVYAIYHPSADYVKADYLKLYSGQVQLAHVAVETGGEAYFTGIGPLLSLAPFLTDVVDHLANQYLLEFPANAPNGPGLQPVTVETNRPDIEIMAPARVWLEGAASNSAPKHVPMPTKTR